MPKLLSSLTECSKFPCKNGGLCTDKDDGTYKCSCINGFSGDQCNDLAGKCLDGHLNFKSEFQTSITLLMKQNFKDMFKSKFCSHLQIIKMVCPIKFEIFKT